VSETRFVAYCRANGRAVLAGEMPTIETQEAMLARHVAAAGGRLLVTYVDNEGPMIAGRPGFASALEACAEHGATLLFCAGGDFPDPTSAETLAGAGAPWLVLDDAGGV